MTLVSVVIPARNAEATLAETIDSLRAQAHPDWEAIVVDDGSSDGTPELARRLAEAEPRVRVVTGEGKGVGAARNLGLAEAMGEYVLFLDADDLILPEHLASTSAPLDRDPETVATHCGWARLNPSGELSVVVHPTVDGDLFAAFAHSCVFPIHACLVRTDVVRRFGAFDTALVTCEDWDLWLRVARSGRPFALEPAVLSYYRMRERSASQDGHRMLADGLLVLERARAVDARVPSDAPHHAGWVIRDLDANRLHHVCWTAGLVLGSGGDPVPLVAAVGDTRSPLVDPEIVAGCLHAATPLPRCLGPEDWPALLVEHGATIDRFLEALERQSGARMLAIRSRHRLEDEIAGALSTGAIGRTAAHELEVTSPIVAVAVEPLVTRVACRVMLEGSPLGELVLPVVDGAVGADVIRDAVAASFAWPILTRFLRAHSTTTTSQARGEGEEAWHAFLRELFARPDWDGERFYDRFPRQAIPRERTVVDSIEISGDLPTLAAGAGRTVAVTLAGAPLGLIELGPGPWPADALVATIATACGLELARVAVRECVLGSPLRTGDSLRQRAAAAAARAQTPHVERGLVLGRRRPLLIGGPGSRRATFPEVAADELRMTAIVAGEPVEGSGAGAVHYAPEVAIRPQVVRPSAARALSARLARPLDYVRRRRGPAYTTVSRRLPILMYHRVVSGVEGPLARYTVEPEMLERHLVALRGSGCRSVSLAEAREALHRRRPLPGRPVLLTFDDGTVDFATHAWPLLERFGFGAVLFVVTDRVGGTNAWDTGLGKPTELLGWEALEKLHRAGLEIGGHSATHPFMSSLSNAEIAIEATRSRRAILEHLGCDPLAFAYPYGDADGVVAHFVGAAGFELAVTTEGRQALLEDEPLWLPRLEVHDQVGPEELLQMLA
ncbi:MAG: glycosyltransferase [Gaiellales bacterium]